MATDPSDAAPGDPRLPGRFWLYWTASVVSWLGDGLLILGLPLLALTLTHNPVLIALVFFIQLVPMFLFSLPLGVIVDRWPARLTAVTVDVLQAAVLVVAGILVYYKHFPLTALMIVAFAMTVLETVFRCADGALLGDIVEPDLFGVAGTRLEAANGVVVYVLSIALGGLLFSRGGQLPLFVDAATFALAALLLATLRLAGHEREIPPAEEHHFVREVKDGLRLTFASSTMRLNAIILCTLAGFQSGSVAIVYLYGTKQLGLSGTRLGVYLAAGNLVAPFFLVILPKVADWKLSRVMTAMIALMCVGELVMGTATTGAQLSIGLAMDGTAVAIGGTALRVARMRQVPRETLGRMIGAIQTLSNGASLAGILVGGAIAHFTLRAPFLLCAAATFLLLVLGGRRLAGMDVAVAGDGAGAADGGEAEAAGVPAQAEASEPSDAVEPGESAEPAEVR